MIKEKPVIVVVAYNRLNSLQRLLCSLNRASCPENTKLIISIDHSEGNTAIVDCANQFEWNSGEKEVIAHPSNLGLRKHILSCGDLSDIYGSVIILEDDLYVSPFFYDYTVQALDFYRESQEIAGVGLFSYRHIEKVRPEPFIPVADSADVYFIQYACSSGQVWTREQWAGFRKWYAAGPDLSQITGMPQHALRWPERSWKKYFIGYMVLHNKFFVQPRVSLTANFDDIGSNRSLSTFEVQSVLLIEQKEFKFKELKESAAVYDSHFEIMPDKIKNSDKILAGYDFAVDLYGNKNPRKIKESFLLTTKKCRNIIHGYAREMKPHEMNVIFNISGDEIVLCRKDDLLTESRKERVLRFVSGFNYFYRTTLSFPELMIFMRYKIFKKMGLFADYHKLPK